MSFLELWYPQWHIITQHHEGANLRKQTAIQKWVGSCVKHPYSWSCTQASFLLCELEREGEREGEREREGEGEGECVFVFISICVGFSVSYKAVPTYGANL